MSTSSNYWNEPNIGDIDWLTSSPNYPDWLHLVELYRNGEMKPLADELRSAQYAPPPEVTRFLADVVDLTFKPPLRNKDKALLSADERFKIATEIQALRRHTKIYTEELVAELLKEVLGKSPTFRENVQALKALRQQPKNAVSVLAKQFGVSEALILKVASRPRKRR